MIVQTLAERNLQDIGHAFAYYDYGAETGMFAAFSSREAVSVYICGYARAMLRAGFLHTTSERGEGYIAYKVYGEKVRLRAVWPLLNGMFHSVTLPELYRLFCAMKRGGPSLQDRFEKEKRPHIFVGMVCVREPYQGQGYMRKVMDIAFAEGDRLGVPVILETDAMSKCEKYQHLGMQLAGIRDLGEFGVLYDLIRYPEKG